jgi:hypothetical protein
VTAVLAAAWLLTGCDSSPSAGGSAGGESGAPGLGNIAATGDPEAVAALRARAQAALIGLIPNAASARYVNVRQGTSGAICGAVETGPEGQFHPFVVTAGGGAAVSASPRLEIANPEDPFPDLYMRYCATIEELSRLGEAMNGVTAALPPLPPEPDPPPLLEDDAAPGQEPEPADAPPRRGDDESFYNAIVRPPR